MEGVSAANRQVSHGSCLARLARHAWLAGVLAGAGCADLPTTPLAHDGSPIVEKPIDPKKRRLPKPETCVGLGNFRLSTAADPLRSPEERDSLRDQARKAFQQAIELDPKCHDAFVGLGRTYLVLEQYENALSTFDRGLKAHPKSGRLAFEKGMCLARLKRWEDSIESLRLAVKSDCENRAYCSALGYSLARAGHFDESYDCFKKVFGEARAHYNLARMLNHVNETDRARRHLELALELRADFHEASELLASLDQPASPQEGTATFPRGLALSLEEISEADDDSGQGAMPAQAPIGN